MVIIARFLSLVIEKNKFFMYNYYDDTILTLFNITVIFIITTTMKPDMRYDREMTLHEISIA